MGRVRDNHRERRTDWRFLNRTQLVVSEGPGATAVGGQRADKYENVDGVNRHQLELVASALLLSAVISAFTSDFPDVAVLGFNGVN